MDLVYGKRFKGYKVIKYKVMEKTEIIEKLHKKLDVKYRQEKIDWYQIEHALTSIFSDAQTESQNGSENEGKRNICPDCKGKRIVDSKVYIKKTCETCKGKGLIE